jgi:hypothetical protein
MRELRIEDLDKLDIIELTDEDTHILQKWYGDNLNYIRNNIDKIKEPFNKVIIIYMSNMIYKNNDIYTSLFYDKKDKLNLQYIYGLSLDFENNKESMLYSKPIDCKILGQENYNIEQINKFNEFASSDILVMVAIYSYMALNEEYVIRKTKTTTKKMQSKKDKRAGKKPKVKLLKQTIIRLNTASIEFTEEEKRDYERHIAGWTVRGFWRNYKDGKRVWIKPHVKGDKNNITGKTYEINENNNENYNMNSKEL